MDYGMFTDETTNPTPVSSASDGWVMVPRHILSALIDEAYSLETSIQNIDEVLEAKTLLVPTCSAPAVAEPLTDGDTLVLRLRGRARYLRDVGEHKSAQLFDEAAQRIQPALFCPRCKVDRLTIDCPNRIGCPMVGEAHGIGTKGSAHGK